MTQVGLLLSGQSLDWEFTSSRDLFMSMNSEILTSEHSGTVEHGIILTLTLFPTYCVLPCLHVGFLMCSENNSTLGSRRIGSSSLGGLCELGLGTISTIVY